MRPPWPRPASLLLVSGGVEVPAGTAVMLRRCRARRLAVWRSRADPLTAVARPNHPSAASSAEVCVVLELPGAARPTSSRTTPFTQRLSRLPASGITPLSSHPPARYCDRPRPRPGCRRCTDARGLVGVLWPASSSASRRRVGASSPWSTRPTNRSRPVWGSGSPTSSAATPSGPGTYPPTTKMSWW